MAIIGARQTALHENLIRIGSLAHIAGGVADLGRRDGAIEAQINHLITLHIAENSEPAMYPK
jgi:hypothetical protein